MAGVGLEAHNSLAGVYDLNKELVLTGALTVVTPRVLRLGTNPNAGLLPERGNCDDFESGDARRVYR